MTCVLVPRLRIAGLALIAGASLIAQNSHADVLEIGTNGSHWVTGKAKDTATATDATSQSAALPFDRPSFSPLFSPVLTSAFGMRMHPKLGHARMHAGIDLAAAEGTPVYATASGRVSFAGNSGGYGGLIQLDHGGATQTRYGHLSRLAVSAGETVNSGQLIGYSGSTGLVTGPHLHYEVRVGGRAVDPLPYLR